MLEQYLSQISDIIRLYEESDGVIVVNRDGVVEHSRSRIHFYLPGGEAVGQHILDLYPHLSEETSTILQVLRTGRPIYNLRQELVNAKGQMVILDSSTLPILVDGRVEGVVDASKFYTIGQHVVRCGPESGLSTLDRLITQDPAMAVLKARVRDVAPLDSPVLISGETGTGKELVAEALHSGSRRAGGPFVSQNCAAIPLNLLESIFFGTEKGSFTGAENRKGLFELADGGTLFLDEINSMDTGLQAKLLKALEDKRVRHVGGTREIPFDVRIVAAMNEDPRVVLREKRIREDLYYRLGVIRLNLPPLRERAGDIPLLTDHFVDRYNREMHRDIRGVSPLVERLFQQYPWPGNVRELQNTVEGAFASARSDTLRIEDVQDILSPAPADAHAPQPEGPPPGEGFSLPRALEEYERRLILQTLRASDSISGAARRLGISRQNLKYKLQKYNLQKYFPLQNFFQD